MGETLGLRVEAHQGVRLHPGFDVPECPVGGGGHGVGFGSPPGRRGPFPYLAAGRVEAADEVPPLDGKPKFKTLSALSVA